MAVPPKRNHRGGLVSRERVAKRGPRGEADSPARASTSAVAKTLTAPPTSVRRVRRCPAVDLATPISTTTPAATTNTHARRGNANRIGAAHQSDFVVRRTPPRHPPKGPPKAVSAGHSVALRCASERRATASRTFSPSQMCGSGSYLTVCGSNWWVTFRDSVSAAGRQFTRATSSEAPASRSCRSFRRAYVAA